MKMNLNKKTLLQIVLLVLLVLGAAGALLFQQEGGLGFLTDLLEEKPPEVTAPPVAATPPPKPAEPVIPAAPVAGQLRGKPFALERAIFEGGVLTLVSGKNAAAAEIRIQLPGARWETPTGKQFKVRGAAPADAPKIAIGMKDEAQESARPKPFAGQYTLALEFAPERERKLPGKIHLALSDESKSTVAGTFAADIGGFRIVGGKPDLAADSTDTLEYLALREVLKDDPDKPIEIVAVRDERYTRPEEGGKRQSGYLEIEYRIGQGAAQTQRFQFVKEADQWKVLRALAADQIDEAHPLEAPGAKGAPARLFPYLAAKRLEADLRKKFPKPGVYGVSFVSRHSDKYKLGVCEASYRPGPEGPEQKTAYLFRLKPGGWVLERELGKRERVNFDSGRIEKRK